jgi:hypothetical protein
VASPIRIKLLLRSGHGGPPGFFLKMTLFRLTFFIRSLLAWTIVLSFSSSHSASEDLPELEDPFPSKWDNTYNVRFWSGYKDNVLLGKKFIESSPFVGGGVDLMFFRMPQDGTEFYAFATADYSQFLSAREVDQEAIAIAQARLKREFGEKWSAAATLQYFYYDQVFDVSALDRELVEFSTLQLQAHNFGFRPSIRRDFERPYWLELELGADRQIFAEVLDDYWQAGPKLTLGRKYGHRSEISLSYEMRKRLYDTRSARDRRGLVIPGTSLELDQHEILVTLRHFWDAERRWRTLTRVGVERNSDNGPGYYDYFRYRFSQQLRYRKNDWEIQGELRVSLYDYDHQTVSLADLSRRWKTNVGFGLRGEKTIYKTVKSFLRYEHEQSISNLFSDEYAGNTVMAGFDWQFENVHYTLSALLDPNGNGSERGSFHFRRVKSSHLQFPLHYYIQEESWRL